jgi:ferrochelatase
MAVIFDLDTEAAQKAAELGLGFARAAPAGDSTGVRRGISSTCSASVPRRPAESRLSRLSSTAASRVGTPASRPAAPIFDPNRPALCQLTTAAPGGNFGRPLALVAQPVGLASACSQM